MPSQHTKILSIPGIEKTCNEHLISQQRLKNLSKNHIHIPHNSQVPLVGFGIHSTGSNSFPTHNPPNERQWKVPEHRVNKQLRGTEVTVISDNSSEIVTSRSLYYTSTFLFQNQNIRLRVTKEKELIHVYIQKMVRIQAQQSLEKSPISLMLRYRFC